MPYRLFAGLLAICLASWLPSTVLSRQAAGPDFLGPNLIDIGGGRRLNVVCEGEGAPTLVFEQGGEGSIVNWREIRSAAAAMTRVCFYDRAGFGYSDPPQGAVTGVAVTDDLNALLKQAGIEGPIVLVGHSIGGFYATLYADRFPEDVAGLVLVDPGFAGQFDPSDPEQRRRELAAINGGYDWLSGCESLARQGRLTADDPQGCFSIAPDRTPGEQRYMLHMSTRPSWYEAEASQSRNYFPAADEEPLSWRQERLARRSFGDMPIVVLTAGITSRERAHTDAAYAEFTERWRAGHRALAARSTAGEAVVVPEARHFIQKDRPRAVIDAISRVLSRVRRDKPALR